MVVEQLERIGELLTVKEAARIKGCTVDALYMAIRHKGLNHYRVGHQILVRIDDLAPYRARGSKKV
jgi:excisionase family DNA binding protein